MTNCKECLFKVTELSSGREFEVYESTYDEARNILVYEVLNESNGSYELRDVREFSKEINLS